MTLEAEAREASLSYQQVPGKRRFLDMTAEQRNIGSELCERLSRIGDHLTLTDAEREAIGVAIQCVEAAMAQRHPEEQESRDLLWKTTCGLRSLLDRTDRT